MTAMAPSFPIWFPTRRNRCREDVCAELEFERERQVAGQRQSNRIILLPSSGTTGEAP
jgi:hypothetical protein